MKIYEIDKAINAELDALENCEETGETPDSILARLDKLCLERDAKISALCAVIKNYEANAEMLDIEGQRIKRKSSAMLRAAEAARWYLNQTLMGEKWTNGIHTVGYRTSEAVEVGNVEHIPAAYMRELLSYEPDKKQIKEDLKNGATIPGCTLSKKVHLQVK